MRDFATRSKGLEIMDDLECSGEVVIQTLRELETINKFLGGNYVTLNGLEQLITVRADRKVSIADLGCGGGDLLRLIKKWSLKHNIPVDLTGIDANPFILKYALENTASGDDIKYEVLNIFSEPFKQKRFDVVTATLFFHHFSDDDLIQIFSQLRRQVRVGLVINDIHRHWAAYFLIKWLTRFFSRSGMVKFDAPLSVLRAFRKKEWKAILNQSGFTHYTIRWMWAFRWQVVVKTG